MFLSVRADMKISRWARNLRSPPSPLCPTRLPTTDEGEGENMDAATVAQLGPGGPTVMHGKADTVQATKQGARGGEDADPRPHRARGQ